MLGHYLEDKTLLPCLKHWCELNEFLPTEYADVREPTARYRYIENTTEFTHFHMGGWKDDQAGIDMKNITGQDPDSLVGVPADSKYTHYNTSERIFNLIVQLALEALTSAGEIKKFMDEGMEFVGGLSRASDELRKSRDEVTQYFSKNLPETKKEIMKTIRKVQDNLYEWWTKKVDNTDFGPYDFQKSDQQKKAIQFITDEIRPVLRNNVLPKLDGKTSATGASGLLEEITNPIDFADYAILLPFTYDVADGKRFQSLNSLDQSLDKAEGKIITKNISGTTADAESGMKDGIVEIHELIKGVNNTLDTVKDTQNALDVIGLLGTLATVAGQPWGVIVNLGATVLNIATGLVGVITSLDGLNDAVHYHNATVDAILAGNTTITTQS